MVIWLVVNVSMFRAANIAIPLECVKCAPSEGERKIRESASPSEGGRSMLEMETRLQAFLWRCPICAPSEGERKMRESASPSEGGTDLMERETRLYGGLAAVVHLRTFGR